MIIDVAKIFPCISKRQLVALFSLFVFGCTKNNSSPFDQIAGKWTLSYQSAFVVYDSAGQDRHIWSVPSYSNDSMNIIFLISGNYTGTFPDTYANNTTGQLPPFWQTENGSFSVHDSSLEITTATSSALYYFLHIGFSQYPGSDYKNYTYYKRLPPNKLVIVTIWGKMGINPYGYDSTILVKLQ